VIDKAVEFRVVMSEVSSEDEPPLSGELHEIATRHVRSDWTWRLRVDIVCASLDVADAILDALEAGRLPTTPPSPPQPPPARDLPALAEASVIHEGVFEDDGGAP
jgi:hypothetical protein